MAKARLENGQVSTYTSNPKPFSIIEGYENGFTVGVNYWGGDALTEQEWQSFGFFPYTPPEYDSRVEEITSITFNESSSIFEAIVSDRTWDESLDDLKASKISNLKNIYNAKLSETDWIIIRDTELGNTTSQSVLDERSALRSECSTKEAEINAISTKRDLALYELPNIN